MEASPDAQLIVTADGRAAYANRAFQALFLEVGQSALDSIAGAIADPESSPDFQRLRSRNSRFTVAQSTA